ncbi:MAG: flagellar hook-basal body complex protein FliE [Deltaproteobacteria bacterium CG11_big_fil_rev_8_21_14_0_20_45_16]|nr:MAG: flagellar hook-basal body complex protein FliE [Deltaproteobacteria bacterium CG11_big_fil_rev_8_21_14_0_20_45_16]
MKIMGPSSVSGIKLSPELEKLFKATSPEKDKGFGELLTEKLNEVDESQKIADKAVTDFSTGKSKNLHEAVLAMEMADTSLRLAVTVRNKVIDAYQEIMRMPV